MLKDEEIIGLYFDRSERAIFETQKKYGKYCFYIARRILSSDLDVEECVNDTYLNLWNSIPPMRPTKFQAFIGKVVRNLSLNKYNFNNAKKRSISYETILDEFYGCVQGEILSFDNEYALKDIMNRFLSTLSKKHRIVFLQRYWYFCSIEEIAKNVDMSENNVKVILHRLREKLKKILYKEGVLI